MGTVHLFMDWTPNGSDFVVCCCKNHSDILAFLKVFFIESKLKSQSAEKERNRKSMCHPLRSRKGARIC